jgi:hypothetical protein
MTIPKFEILRALLLICSLFIPTLFYLAGRIKVDLARQSKIILTFYSLIPTLFLLFLFINHLNYPLNLEGLELSRLQHARRALNGLPIFVDPTAEFVPYVYQPLYYYFVLPFISILGDKLSTLRFVSILATIGSTIIIYLAVKKSTNSNWWGLLAISLFCSAYRAMDSYLDIASVDSLLLFSLLLGCYLISNNHKLLTNILSILILVLAFWFKQHGALFVIASLLYLTWRKGWRWTLILWIIAVIFGPVLYYLAGPSLFGPKLLYYTQEIPSQWLRFSWEHTIVRVIEQITINYLALCVSAIVAAIILIKKNKNLEIWWFNLPFALLSGFLATLVDPAGNNNPFIPMGVWIIITGVMGLYELSEVFPRLKNNGVVVMTLTVSFVLLIYNPKSVIISPKAFDEYRDLITLLKSIDGTVYAPEIGQLSSDYTLYPEIHSVAIVDLYRPELERHEFPQGAYKILEPVISPKGAAYILIEYPLQDHILLRHLANYYTLDTDLGERFGSLRNLPARYSVWGGPKYLYRYSHDKSIQMVD